MVSAQTCQHLRFDQPRLSQQLISAAEQRFSSFPTRRPERRIGDEAPLSGPEATLMGVSGHEKLPAGGHEIFPLPFLPDRLSGGSLFPGFDDGVLVVPKSPGKKP